MSESTELTLLATAKQTGTNLFNCRVHFSWRDFPYCSLVASVCSALARWDLPWLTLFRHALGLNWTAEVLAVPDGAFQVESARVLFVCLCLHILLLTSTSLTTVYTMTKFWSWSAATAEVSATLLCCLEIHQRERSALLLAPCVFMRRPCLAAYLRNVPCNVNYNGKSFPSRSKGVLGAFRWVNSTLLWSSLLSECLECAGKRPICKYVHLYSGLSQTESPPLTFLQNGKR